MRNNKTRAKTISFDLLTNGMVREVRTTPYSITTGEIRYRVSVNEEPVQLFAWDEGLGRWASMEDGPSRITGNVEMAIAKMLQGYTVEMKVA